MKTIRTVVATLLMVCSCLLSTAHATAYSTDQSDLWWVPAESGWGLQLVQRGSTIFATMFVYGSTGAPTWYIAVLDPTTTPLMWSGSVYAATGPWFVTNPFNPALVQSNLVGSMTWTAQSVADGQLSYTINGNAVTKNVTRETIAADDLSGTYTGAVHQLMTGCSNSTLNGPSTSGQYITFIQSGTAINVNTIPILSGGGSCSYSGTAQEFGQMGEVDGTFSCSNGNGGSFSMFEIQVNPSGLTGRVELSYSTPTGCEAAGWLGGARTPPDMYK